MSDQDFFFDEDEQAAPAKEAKPARRTSTTAKGTTTTAPAAAPGMMAQSVSMAVASLIGVIALLAGVIIGIVIPVGGGTPQPTAPTTVAPTQGGNAPQLSPEQLQGGELPEGHPNIGGEPSGTATDTSK